MRAIDSLSEQHDTDSTDLRRQRKRQAMLLTMVRSALFLVPFFVPGSLFTQEPVPSSDGQRPEVDVTINKEVRERLKIAVPVAERPKVLPAAASDAADEMEKTLRNDLDLSGVFEVQGPEVLQTLKLTGDRARDFELYRSLTNEMVLLSEIRFEDDRLILEGAAYDLESGEFIFGKRYKGTVDLTRRIAHKMSDELVLFAGGRGVALTSIAFTSDRDAEQRKELYLMDYDGYNQRRITAHNSMTLSPEWSPTGESIAYVSYFQGPPSIYRVDVLTGDKTGVIVDDGHSLSPAYSPDGTQIAFARSTRGNTDIFIIPAKGGEPRQLTKSGAIDTNPSWSPDGKQIAFTSSRSGSTQIYLMNADGSNNPIRLTFEGTYNEGAEWHPDGDRIVFSSRVENGSRFDIAVVELACRDDSWRSGTSCPAQSLNILEMRRLTSGPGNHEAPTYSPNGRFIAYESNRAGGRQIFVMDAEGTGIRQLTSIGNNYGPSWSNYVE